MSMIVFKFLRIGNDADLTLQWVVFCRYSQPVLVQVGTPWHITRCAALQAASAPVGSSGILLCVDVSVSTIHHAPVGCCGIIIRVDVCAIMAAPGIRDPFQHLDLFHDWAHLHWSPRHSLIMSNCCFYLNEQVPVTQWQLCLLARWEPETVYA
jgi:hypothetical protein